MQFSRRTFGRGFGLAALSLATGLKVPGIASAEGPRKFDLEWLEPGDPEVIKTFPDYLRIHMTGPVKAEWSRVQIMGRTGLPREVSPIWVNPAEPNILVMNFPHVPDDKYEIIFRAYSTSGEWLVERYSVNVATQGPLSGGPAGWPPIRVGIEPFVTGQWAIYQVWVWNISKRPTMSVTVRGLLPPGARLAKSFLWTEGRNPGSPDGTTVGWTLGEAVPPSLYDEWGNFSSPYGPFCYVLDTAGMPAGSQLVSRGAAEWIIYSDGEWWADEFWESQQGGTSISEDAVIVIGPNGPFIPGR
jgi:hypothetical protein